MAKVPISFFLHRFYIAFFICKCYNKDIEIYDKEYANGL
ncbi:MAG TPA: hypothetical protein DHV15_00095 [Treponema sp.]|uniref:Uncharacterized protein n=1 Tax=Treponema denticola (strain ATCC 35405 / DSM 14222 / CIP 103919 / JCM 8153 / KCTC 15104) TaxID=243275 RepID=Q73LX7_TREDE|nr:hypothetical protein TDE_1735 [Treponema denticola ATCC 35405]HCY93903.1 hypothetical protein [Treponema sp.]